VLQCVAVCLPDWKLMIWTCGGKRIVECDQHICVCIIVCCSGLQHVAVRCGVLQCECGEKGVVECDQQICVCVVACCSVLQ